ncbi:tRNA threonylcarbamoyladenosine dehydratase [Desulfovibrionales bacterium]
MRFARTLQLLGVDNFARLNQASVAIFGIGAVGSYAVEALARAGVGRLVLYDHDVVSASNINRQLLALDSTLGRSKVVVASERIHDINPECKVMAHPVFVNEESLGGICFSDFDVVVDAIDGVNAKVNLIVAAHTAQVPIVSSMGAAAKLDPSCVQAADLSRTEVCPLAQIMRKRLRRRGVSTGVRCVFSTEQPCNTNPPVVNEAPEHEGGGRPRVPLGSLSYLTGIFGLFVASEVIHLLLHRTSRGSTE